MRWDWCFLDFQGWVWHALGLLLTVSVTYSLILYIIAAAKQLPGTLVCSAVPTKQQPSRAIEESIDGLDWAELGWAG